MSQMEKVVARKDQPGQCWCGVVEIADLLFLDRVSLQSQS